MSGPVLNQSKIASKILIFDGIMDVQSYLMSYLIKAIFKGSQKRFLGANASSSGVSEAIWYFRENT